MRIRKGSTAQDEKFMLLALQLARRGYGTTSPNPMVGAVLVKRGAIIGRGWHRRAGEAHAEVEALQDAPRRGSDPRGATLYVTLEPCSTHGRTPPCTDAIKTAEIKRVVVAATDPNPAHAGNGFELLRRGGIELRHGILEEEATRLNQAFNHWMVHRTPFVTVKAAMSMDGKIATRTGESKWITSEKSRGRAMELRYGADAILVGINTILYDDPSLTARGKNGIKALRRIVLDSDARTPLTSRVVSDEDAQFTTVVVGQRAAARKVAALESKVQVWRAPACVAEASSTAHPRGTSARRRPEQDGQIELRWVLNKLGGENVTGLLVEGGGEVNASFLLGGFAQQVVFFYAPMIIGGNEANKSVAGIGILDALKGIRLFDVKWERVGVDLLLTARVEAPRK